MNDMGAEWDFNGDSWGNMGYITNQQSDISGICKWVLVGLNGGK